MPAFPQPFTSTVSHWQATNRGLTSLWNHGRDAPLPQTADYIIIGAGATGAALAYHLTRPGAAEGKSIVILEAKDVASGASGRNGGHIAPHSWNAIEQLTAPVWNGAGTKQGSGLTPEEALEMYYFELENLDLVEEIVEKEKLDVDFWRGTRLEVITSEERAAQTHENLAAFRKALAASERFRGRPEGWEPIFDPVEATKVSRIKNTKAVLRGPGGSWHPHRGVTALLRLALESTSVDCQLFSWTPVGSIDRNANGWTVDCGARGTVTAANVILCTNAYTSHLFPDDRAANKDLAAHIVPYRGHAARIVPPTTYSGADALTTTYGIERGPYLIPTPHSGLIMGPFNATVIDTGIGTRSDLYFLEDDSVVVPKLRSWLETYCKDEFEGWGEETPGEGLVHAWTGIMAMSVDILPLVGRVPGKPGLWASMGYNGHGMALIVNIARSLAHMLEKDDGEWDPRLPRSLEITEERLKRAPSLREAFKD